MGLNTKESINQPIYGWFYSYKYSQIIGYHNKWISLNFSYNGTDEKIYKHINQTILDGNVMNIYLIIMLGKYGAIDNDDYYCHGYYIIKFSSSTYTLKIDLSSDGQVISSGKMVSGSRTIWEKLTSGYHNYSLKGLNLRYMYFSQKTFWINWNTSIWSAESGVHIDMLWFLLILVLK